MVLLAPAMDKCARRSVAHPHSSSSGRAARFLFASLFPLLCCSTLVCCSLPQGKQNRGRFQVIAVPRLSEAAPPTAAAALATATAASSASARLPIVADTGLVQTPWYGPEWSSNKLGIAPKHATPSLAELRKRFPGLDNASLSVPDVNAAAAAEADMADADATPKKPVTSLSRRSIAGSASRPGTRGPTPAPSAPGSPSLRSTPAGASASMSDMDMGGSMSTPSRAPSRTPVGGKTWKVVGSGDTSIPSHALVVSGAVKSKTLRKSWADKQKKREEFLAARERQRRINESDAEARRESARKAKQKADMKAENEKKNQIVQVISDTRKIKNMSRKQLRSVQKMETGHFKSNSVSSAGLARGLIPKGQ